MRDRVSWTTLASTMLLQTLQRLRTLDVKSSCKEKSAVLFTPAEDVSSPWLSDPDFRAIASRWYTKEEQDCVPLGGIRRSCTCSAGNALKKTLASYHFYGGPTHT